MPKGVLLILSGPSGVGKDSLINAWKAINPMVERVVAYTTRDPREGEVDGVDYHFVPAIRFKEMADAGAFLEWKEVHGNYYATPLKDMERMLEQGRIAILKIDVQGALSVMSLRPDAVSVFVMPPSWEELERRISSRGLDSKDVVLKRLENAKGEIALADKYQHQVVNDNLVYAAQRLQKIVAGASGAK